MKDFSELQSLNNSTMFYFIEFYNKALLLYAETKQICENIIKGLSCNNLSLRYFTPIGSNDFYLIGDCFIDNPSNLVPIVPDVESGIRDNLFKWKFN